MKKRIILVFAVIAMIPCFGGLFLACLGPMGFDPDSPINIKIPNEITTTDITAAVLQLTNRSKTVDVTNVTITQPEWTAPVDQPNAQPSTISFAHKPRRLEQKAQYLSPSDKSYQVVIDYAYDALEDIPEGTGSQTLIVPLPLPRQIVELNIFRKANGDVMIERDFSEADPADTGPVNPDPLPGEGSSPAVIPPELRSKMATFVVVSKTSSQIIDSINFRMRDSNYTMGRVGANDKQSIALGQGSWETRVKYTRQNVEKTLGPANSIIVPSNDPQAVQEHYLYFYLNKHGDYSISQTWPPFPNDVEEEDLLPPDNGFGRGLVKIINNSYAMAKTVTVYNLNSVDKFPHTVDYDEFTPPIPVQYNKTGYVNIVGTERFPIEAHEGYLIQVSIENNEGFALVERKAYLKDQVVTIVIDGHELNINNAQGAKITLENKVQSWPVEIIALTVRNKANVYQGSYYSASSWSPAGVIELGKSAIQYVVSSPAMPITERGEFEARVTLYGNGVAATITKPISPAILYSELPLNQNPRTITIVDADVPSEIRGGVDYTVGATFTLENRVSSWPVEIAGMKILNKDNVDQSSFYGPTTWTPPAMIGKNQSAEQLVMSSADMPINPDAVFEALITLYGSGKTAIITKLFTPEELYSDLAPEQNTRSISINDSDVPDVLKDAYDNSRGAKIIIENNVSSWPVEVVGMTIRNIANTNQRSHYGPATWVPAAVIGNSQSAEQLVMSSANMPIRSGIQFEAVFILSGNGQTATKVKPISPAALYSELDPAQNIRNIVIADADVPDTIKGGDGGSGVGATVTIENRISSWPVEIIGMMVQNKANTSQNSYYGSTSWQPRVPIGKNQSAEQTVMSSPNMPITSGVQFEALIVLLGSGQMATVTKAFNPAALYSTLAPELNPRTITVNDADVPDIIKDAYIYTRGAKVTIENNVSSWPIQITNMTVRNKANVSQNTYYGSSSWSPSGVINNNGSAIQMVGSSAAMPIRAGVEFEAVLTLYGNGKADTVTRSFSPAILYSDSAPEQNTRTITITDADVRDDLKPPPVDPPEKEKQDEIDNAEVGDIILIDGIPWVKVRADSGGNVLLLLYGVISGGVAPMNTYLYHPNVNFMVYSKAEIKTSVDSWYKNLQSPILKKIALQPVIPVSVADDLTHTGLSGASSASAPAGTKTDTIVFIPKLADIINLQNRDKPLGNNNTYWLTDFIVPAGWSKDQPHMGIIKPDGSLYHREAANYASVRPVIWVATR